MITPEFVNETSSSSSSSSSSSGSSSSKSDSDSNKEQEKKDEEKENNKKENDEKENVLQIDVRVLLSEEELRVHLETHKYGKEHATPIKSPIIIPAKRMKKNKKIK